MKAQEYREMTRDELEVKLEELEKRIYEIRSQAVTEKLENSQAVKNARREIARVKTILRETAQAD